MALAFASAFFAALTSVLAKAGLKNVNSHVATAVRTGVVLVFSWAIVCSTGAQEGIAGIEPRSWWILIASGLATGASWLCYFRALQLGRVGQVMAVDKSSTVLTILLAALFLSEPLSWQNGLCMAAIGGGSLLMVDWGKKTDAVSRRSSWFLWAAGSAVFASLTAILGKWGMEGIDSNLGTAIRTAVVLVMAWGMVFLLKKQKEVRTFSRKNWFFLLVSGLATGASWLCYFRALQIGPVSLVVPVDKLSILLTVLLAFLCFGERLRLREAWGLFLMTAGTLAMVFLS